MVFSDVERRGLVSHLVVYKFVRNKLQSEFLTGEVEYCQSRECLSLESSMVKSSMLLNYKMAQIDPQVKVNVEEM